MCKGEIMEQAIKMLREQMILCKRLVELFDALRNELKNNSSGAGVTAAVQAIEPVMLKLSKQDKQIQEFLKSTQFANLQEFVAAQSESVEKNVAERLLSQNINLQKELNNKLEDSSRMLLNSKAFIDFTMNVMSRTTASDIYGPPGTAMRNNSQSIFRANI